MSKVMRTHTGITEWNGDYWCDSCGKRVRGITIVNGMDFCAKCYQETFGENEKDRKIADLEAKLAESEKKHLIDEKEWQDYCAFKHIEPQIKGCLDREREYEKQLAEKDEEIAYLTKQVKKFNNEAQKYFEDAYCNDFHNQDKISFAVEVLKIAQDYVQQYVNNFDDMNDCLCAIDNQIKRLTHQHEDK